MASKKNNVERQITELRKNLELIEVRKSEYVQATDIPLQLIKTEEETRARLAVLEADLHAADGDARDHKHFPRWLLTAGIVIALSLAGILYWRNHEAVEPTLMPPVPTSLASATPGLTAQTTSVASATPISPTLNSGQAISFPPLPDVAPALTTTVLLLSSPVCASELRELATFLAETTNEKTPPVVLESTDVSYHLAEERSAVRSIGATSRADLVTWCTDEKTGTEIHFEALTQRATPEVYEPPTLSMPLQPIDRSQRAALGMIDYLRRDYSGAEPVLRTATDMSPEEEVAAALTLLIGNAQTFRHDYANASASFDQVVATQPGWAFAWHNLGVAELYSAWRSHDFDKALASFEQARALDPAFDLSLVSMARIYRWTYDEVPDGYEKAFAGCAQIEQSQDEMIRIHGTICKVLTTVLTGWNSDISTELPQIGDREALEDAATLYWAEPLAAIGIVQNLYWSAYDDQIARQQARTYFERCLREAYDDVHLEESRQLYIDIVDSYVLLQEDSMTQ